MSAAALALSLSAILTAGVAIGYAVASERHARRYAAAWRYLADVAEVADGVDTPALAAGGVALALATETAVSEFVARTAAATFPVEAPR